MASTGVIPVEDFLCIYTAERFESDIYVIVYNKNGIAPNIQCCAVFAVKLLSESAADSYIKFYRTSAAFNSDFNRKS